MTYVVGDFPLYEELRSVERPRGMNDETAQMAAPSELGRAESLERARDVLADHFMKHLSFRSVGDQEKREYASAALHARYLRVGTPFFVGNRGYRIAEVNAVTAPAPAT